MYCEFSEQAVDTASGHLTFVMTFWPNLGQKTAGNPPIYVEEAVVNKRLTFDRVALNEDGEATVVGTGAKVPIGELEDENVEMETVDTDFHALMNALAEKLYDQFLALEGGRNAIRPDNRGFLADRDQSTDSNARLTDDVLNAAPISRDDP